MENDIRVFFHWALSSKILYLFRPYKPSDFEQVFQKDYIVSSE